jgi:hypothetical protein
VAARSLNFMLRGDQFGDRAISPTGCRPAAGSARVDPSRISVAIIRLITLSRSLTISSIALIGARIALKQEQTDNGRNGG